MQPCTLKAPLCAIAGGGRGGYAVELGGHGHNNPVCAVVTKPWYHVALTTKCTSLAYLGDKQHVGSQRRLLRRLAVWKGFSCERTGSQGVE